MRVLADFAETPSRVDGTRTEVLGEVPYIPGFIKRQGVNTFLLDFAGLRDVKHRSWQQSAIAPMSEKLSDRGFTRA